MSLSAFMPLRHRLPELLLSTSVEFRTVRTFVDSALSSSLTISDVTCHYQAL